MQTLDFNFITDAQFREDLTRDYSEMQRCAETSAWKAVHVIAGSIVEAVLVDYLIGTAKQSKPDPLTMGLGDLIAAGKKAGVLSKKSADLSAALKEYRNLIHPGRAKRLNDTADAEGANVAQSLVRLIVREISAKQVKEHGLTAEQVVRKFETDPTADAVAEHLVKATPSKEIERLLLEVLPMRYLEQVEEEEYIDDSVLGREINLFHTAFGQAPDGVRKAVMAQYVAVLKEEPGSRVKLYEQDFFRAGYLAFVTKEDRDLVVKHLLSQLESEAGAGVFRAARGIGHYLSKEDINPFVDALIRVTIRQHEVQTGKEARSLLEGESSNMPAETHSAAIERLQGWVRAYERQDGDHDEKIALIQEIKDAYEIPF